MGKAIILSNCNFSQHNLGRVTFAEDVPVTAITINGASTVIGGADATTYSVSYYPSYTSEQGVIWTITEGSTYASIASNGKLSVLSGASGNSVTIKATSVYNDSVFATKVIEVTYMNIVDNDLTVNYGTDYVSLVASSAVTSNLTITISGDISQTFTINSGSTSANTTFSASTVDRNCTLSVSPISDNNYKYVLSESAITIPAMSNVNIIIVGPSDIAGDKRAGNYFILDTSNMKQVVGTSSEVTDDFKEYLGSITWSVDSNTYADVENSAGTEGLLDIKSNATTAHTLNILATVNGHNASKSVQVKYLITDYEISSFADLQALESAVNNGTESSFTLPLASGSTYTPVAGFSGAHFRLTNDIDCGNSHVEIGRWNTSLSVDRPFKGIFDGAGYSINNVGGNCGVNGSASEGGYVGSALFGYGNGCRVKNFKINGNVTWTGTRGYATIMAIYKGTCYFERIYNNVTASAVEIASGNGLFLGWSTSSSSDYFAITHSVVAGSQHSGGGSIIGCGQAYNSNTGYGVYATAILGEYTIGGLSTASAKNLSLFQSSGTKATSKRCYAIAKVSTEFTSASALYIAGAVSDQNYEACNIASNFASKKISDGTITNTYTQNGITGGTSVTENDLRNTQTVTDSLYIHTEGYYPIIDNQFAVMPLVLSRAKYGYTE